MKKTLFLAAILSLNISAWGTDCMMPQTIISVDEGSAVTQDATNATEHVTISVMPGLNDTLSVSELMTQKAQQVTGNRPAVVKDGQGTLLIGEDVGTVENPLLATLVVREGTMKIDGATVTTLGSSNGNNLAVGGCHATLELTNGARYVYTDENKTSSSVSIGGIDGDGTLILAGGSTLSTRQQVQAGSYSSLPIPTGADPYWEVGPHLGGTYTKVQGSADNSYYRVSTDAAGYSNQTITPNEALVSTGHILVKEGSTLDVGTGFYVGNGTLTIDNATVLTATKAATEDSFIGSPVDFGPASKSVVTIRNGGKWYAEKNKSIAISYRDGQQSEVTITGQDSLMQAGGVCYIGSNNTGQSDVKILDGGQMDFGTYVYARGTADSSHTILVDGEGAVFSSPAFYLYGATALTVSNGGCVTGTNFDGIRSDIAVRIQDGGLLDLTGRLTLSNSATLEVTGNGARTQTRYATLQSGAEVVINEGACLSSSQVLLRQDAALINRGTLEFYENYYNTVILFGGSRIQTGEALISGCEGLAAEGHAAEVAYSEGFNIANLRFAADCGVTDDGGVVTLGALLVGRDKMQYLSSSDLKLINNTVLSGLSMAKTAEAGDYVTDTKGNYVASNEAYTIVFKHEIGENITMNYTTDDLNNVTGQESIAVSGGAILVELGEGEHHVGTIGSYAQTTTETDAAIAVHEQTAGSKVRWEGAELQTVVGEATKLTHGTTVQVGENESVGTLTVVEGSTLENDGVIEASTVVEGGGLLKGCGTMGALTLSNGAALIVGHSPGLQTFTGDVYLADGSETTFSVTSVMTPATETLQGWDSETYSQIRLLGDASFSVAEGAAFVITFGGDMVFELAWGEEGLSFDLVLVHGGVSSELVNLSALSENTRVAITDEADGIPSRPVTISTGNLYYTVENSDLVLHGTLYAAPEPTAATLSLLALAGLVVRRRRK